MKKLVVLGILSIFALAILLSAVYLKKEFFDPRSKESIEIIFDVAPGESFLTVASKLQKQGLIKSARAFNYYARLTQKRDLLKVGEYSLNKSMNMSEILNVIISGKSVARSLTISEGLNIYEIADLIENSGFGDREEFLKIVKDPNLIQQLLGKRQISLEGYLFPETYMLTKFTDLEELVRKMVQTFKTVFSEIEPLAPSVGLTPEEVVILASIIEKETGAEWERPLISSVFHNRLKKKMRLQTDPTILYGIAEENNKVVLKISRADIRRPTRYNTYVINGLPPGPIANPGKEALLAAVKPEKSEYLYFVSQNDGTHVFSKTYAEHNKAVREYQKNPAARKGKSWRDLQR